MHEKSAGEAGWHCWRQEAIPHSWTQWWQLQLEALCPLQLWGRHGTNHSSTGWKPTQGPWACSAQRQPWTSAGRFASLKLWKGLGTCTALRHRGFFYVFLHGFICRLLQMNKSMNEASKLLVPCSSMTCLNVLGVLSEKRVCTNQSWRGKPTHCTYEWRREIREKPSQHSFY